MTRHAWFVACEIRADSSRFAGIATHTLLLLAEDSEDAAQCAADVFDGAPALNVLDVTEAVSFAVVGPLAVNDRGELYDEDEAYVEPLDGHGDCTAKPGECPICDAQDDAAVADATHSGADRDDV